MTDRYGRTLVAIAVLLVGGGLASLHSAVALYQGLAVGGLLASVFIYEALFRDPPVPSSEPTVVAAVLLWHVLVAWLVVVGFF